MRRAFSLFFCIICIFVMFPKTVANQDSLTRTCQFVWGYSSPPQRWHINMTGPVYATPGSTVSYYLVFLFGTAVNIAPPEGAYFEVSVLSNNRSWHQIYHSLVLSSGHYTKGTKRSMSINVTIPNDTKLGSFLNVKLYTNWNEWMPYPTEIRCMSYDELHSGYVMSLTGAAIAVVVAVVGMVGLAIVYSRRKKVGRVMSS